jgi:outer membrane protein
VKNQNHPLIPKTNLIVLLLAVVSLAIGSVSLTLHFTKSKIVYIDAIKLLGKYHGMVKARTELEAKSATWQANLDTLKSEFDRALQRFEKNKNSSSDRENKLSQELIASKQQQFMDYQSLVKEQYEKADKELSGQILGRVNDYIKQYGEKHGYEIILAATTQGNIAYGHKSLDLTDEILKGLNDEYQIAK